MPPEDIHPDINPPIDPEFPHRYFFTYAYQIAGVGLGFGNFSTTLRLPIRGVDDVLYVTGLIREGKPTFTGIVIVSWQKFED